MCPGGCWGNGNAPYSIPAGTKVTPIVYTEGDDINAVARKQSCGLMYIQLNAYIQAQITYFTNKGRFATDLKKEIGWFTTQEEYNINVIYSDAYKQFIEAAPKYVGLNRLVAGVYRFKPQGLISTKSLLLTGVNNRGVLTFNSDGYQTVEPTIVGYSNQCF